MKKIVASFIIICCLMCLLYSCSITGGTNYGTGGVSQFNDGYVMAVQTSPDAPHLSVFVDGSPWDTGMVLGSNTYYAQAPPGTYKFSVGRTDDSSSALLDTVTLNIAANAYYSYFIIDSFKSLQAAVLQDNFLRPSGDSFYVRFLNFCPNSNVINLIDSARGTFWASNRTFNDQTAVATNGFFGEHLRGPYTLFMSNSGSTDTVVKQQFTFNGGYVYTLYAAGLEGSNDSIKKLTIHSYQNYPQH